MDAKCAKSSEIGSEWRTILGHPQLIECMGICVLSLAHFQPGYVPLDGLCLEFSRDFSKKKKI